MNTVRGFYRDIAEVEHALQAKVVGLHSKIKFRWPSVDEKGETVDKWYETTPGRALLGQVLPRSSKVPFDVVNKLMTKREISSMIDTVYRHCGQKETVIFCDRIMALGFHHAFKAGISFGKDDMVVPQTKWKIVDETRELAKEFEQQYNDGLITQGEKYNKVVDAWSKSTDQIADAMMKEISSVKKDEDGREAQVNSIYMMAHSGARGSPAQMRQLAGMRGLMAKPSGEIIETPDHLELQGRPLGARVLQLDPRRPQGSGRHRAEDRELGLPDAASGRRRAGLHHHVRGLRHQGRHQGARHHRRRHRGRLAGDPHPRPHHRRGRQGSVDRQGRRQAQHAARASRRSRRSSRPTCRSCASARCSPARPTNGVCGACYGRDLARGTPVNMGEAVGVIAAQSIGEPGTQLTMRTFHIGGAAQISEQSFIESNFDGKIKIKTKGKNAVVKNSDGDWIAMGRNIVIAVADPDGTERAVHRIQNGARLRVEDGEDIKRGQRIAEWDPYTRPILTEVEGTVAFEDLVEGQSMSEAVDESTGIAKRVVIDWRTSTPGRRPAAGDGHQGQGRQGPEARARRRRPLPAGGRRHPVGRSRRAR